MRNSRKVIFAGVMVLLVGSPLYYFLNEKLSRGVYHQGFYYKKVDLKAIGAFELDPQTGSLADLPNQYRALDGQKLFLEGEIYDPQEAGKDITEFQLVGMRRGDFCGPPRVQERVFCTVPNEKLNYRGPGYHKVFGTLHVTMKREKLADGRNCLIEVYHLDADSVERSKSY